MYFIILFVLLILMTIISFFINKKDILSPSFVFSMSLLFCCTWAMFYYNQWELNTFHLNTFFIVAGGVVEFILVSYAVKKIIQFVEKKCNGKCLKDKKISNEVGEIKINIFIKIAFLIFAIVVLFFHLKTTIDITGGSWDNIKNAVYQYDRINKFSETIIVMPKIMGISLLFFNAILYWCIYVIVNNFISKKKIEFVLLGVVICGILDSFSTGGRTNVINMLITFVAFFLILYRKKCGIKMKLGLKSKIAICIFPIVILTTFPYSVKLMGRKSSTDPVYYLAIYCGAEIKNLDLFAQELDTYEFDENSQTFNNLNKWIGGKLHKVDDYKLDLPFRKVNNLNLGNVYTVFYPFLYDYGYWGIVGCVALMAFILQLVYECVLREKSKDRPSLFTLIYGYMFSSIVFAFFSNKFYEQNFNKKFIYAVIFWVVINYILKDKEKIIDKIKMKNLNIYN